MNNISCYFVIDVTIREKLQEEIKTKSVILEKVNAAKKKDKEKIGLS